MKPIERMRTTTRRVGRAAAEQTRAATQQTGVLWIFLAALAPVIIALLRWTERRARGRRVREVMVNDVMTIDASATLAEAARRMRDGNVGALPVVSDGQLVGMITDRDLVVRAMADGVDPSAARIGGFSTRDLVCARPESSIEEAMEVMSECQIGRLPVVDRDNRVVGMVTLSSLALRSRQQPEALQTAQEVSRRSARVA